MGDQRCAAVATFIAVCTFALSGTLPLRAIWIEIPALSTQVPEGSNLYIYVLVISECSNIAAIVYLLIQKCSKQASSEARVIYGCLMLGITSMVTLGLFWQDMVPGLTTSFSFTLLSSVLLASVVSSVSTVTYIPFVSRLKESYMNAAMAGEALSSLIPHVLATVQGIGQAPDCFAGGNSEPVANASTVLSSVLPRPTSQALNQRTTPVIHLTRHLSLQFSEQVYFLAHAGFITLSLLSFIAVRCTASFDMTGDQPAATNVEIGLRGQRSSGVKKIHGAKTKEVWQSKRTISRPTTVLDDGTIRQSSILFLHPSKHPDRSCTAEQAPLTGGGGGAGDAPLSHSDDCETTSDFNNQSLHRASHPGPKFSAGVTPQRRYSRVSSTDRAVALKAAAGTKPKLFPLLMVIVLWSSYLMNGPLSSVYSYSCFSVGNNAFLVGVILCDIFTLFSCLLSSRTTEMSVVIAFTCLGTILLTYFLALIIFSLETQAKEFPPFNNTGEILAVG